jgi:hypothetical protein
MNVKEMMEILAGCHPEAEVILADLDWPIGHPFNREGGPTFLVDQCEQIGGLDQEYVVAIWSTPLSKKELERMKLFIPACGDRVTLTKPWAFDLYLERRNVKFAQSLKLIPEKFDPWNDCWTGERYRSALKSVTVILPKGSVLECDRVYIRVRSRITTFSKSALETGNDYDSITWKLLKGEKATRAGRFWAKLPDCYSIEYSLQEDSLYRDRVKLVKLVQES